MKNETLETSMKIVKYKIPLAFCVIALVSLVLLLPLLQPTLSVHHAVTNAIDFLKESNEPFALLWLDVIYRRFEIPEFADSSKRYDQLLNDSQGEPLQLRVFRRIANYNNSLWIGDLEGLVDLDSIVGPALYCDRLGLTLEYQKMIEAKVNLGEYELTHVLLAWIWIQDNGCEVFLSESFIEKLYNANAELIDNDQIVDDLELEAGAFLYLAGQGELVDESFIQRVIATQNTDGGWGISSKSSRESNWHPTILGLLLLLHIDSPSALYPPILAPASP